MKNTALSIALLAAILLLLNILSNKFFLRADLTEGRQYTLSRATKDILKNLDEPVTITAYFSDDLPPDVAKTRRDFQDMLVEYANISKGDVRFEFISPEDDAQKKEATDQGIQPLMINVREKDQVKQQQAYMGALVRMGDRQEPIPFIQPEMAMEYALSTSIKKLSVTDKPVIGFLQGHGEAALNEMGQVYEQLSILYTIAPVSADSAINPSIRAVAVIAPRDSFPPAHLQQLDAYLSQGGKLVLAVNAVNGDLSAGQGTPVSTGLESWLAAKGVKIEPGFLIDAQCGSVTLQQQQGFFMINTPVQFPFLPLISDFREHPAVKGIEQVMMPFASPISFVGGNQGIRFTPIAFSSARSGIVNAPTVFDVQKKWTTADFPLGGMAVGGVLEGNLAGNTPSKLVVFGDGDFAVSGQNRVQPDNVSLLVNSIDWLSDDTGLIELRTKGVASRPIDQSYLGDEAKGARNMLKAVNVGLPILLALLYGIFNAQRQRAIRNRRMA
ncbi:MAG: Gldg family protein [Saprospiraceae bacterium]|jgi:gliding-associated putative ABC transporter substrate-binding component GldG|nr:Gldg family protein [Saprospiraceae bacterium]